MIKRLAVFESKLIRRIYYWLLSFIKFFRPISASVDSCKSKDIENHEEARA